MNIHDRLAAARSGRWRAYKVCSDLNSQPKRPGDLDLDLESGVRVTCATSVPILVILGLSVLELGPMYATDSRQKDRRQTASSFNAPAY